MAMHMRSIKNNIINKTICKRLQIEHGRIPQRTHISGTPTPTNIDIILKYTFLLLIDIFPCYISSKFYNNRFIFIH